MESPNEDPLIDRIVQDAQAGNMLNQPRAERIRKQLDGLLRRLAGTDWLVGELLALRRLFDASPAPEATLRAAEYRRRLFFVLLNAYPDELRAIHAPQTGETERAS